MKTTYGIPNVPLKKFKRTKIIATVGPSTDSYESIHKLIKAGANGLRLNFSHGTEDERTQQIKWIRKASNEVGKPVAIIQDLQGPKIRCGDFEDIINIQKGQSLQFKYKADYERSGMIPTQYDLSKKMKRGERLYLYDGKVKTIVTSVKDGVVHARAENSGIVIKRKGINLPDTDFGGDIITAKDKKDIAYGTTQDIDYVALSFVQHANDIDKLRRMLRSHGSSPKIIAKIETNAGVANIEGIIETADAIMIARGDLAIETSAESVPIVQRKIIGLGQKHAKLTIVATQMLATMTETPEPTRAEVSDVATAVILGTDCVMLSDETASGQYPIEAVKVMKRVVLYAEANMPLQVSYPGESKITGKQAAISEAVIQLADNVEADAIIAETKSGATALQISSRRPSRSIIAVTSDKTVAQQLALVYGVKSYVRADHRQAAMRLVQWLHHNRAIKKGDVVVTASGRYPGVIGTTDTIKVRVIE